MVPPLFHQVLYTLNGMRTPIQNALAPPADLTIYVIGVSMANRGPQTAQLNIMGTTSFAMIETSVHLGVQACCNHQASKHAPHPQ